jgi:hypothetical protein
MDGSFAPKIIQLKAFISVLKRREKLLHDMINSTLTAPDIRENAKAELASLLEDLSRAGTELERLEPEIMAEQA